MAIEEIGLKQGTQTYIDKEMKIGLVGARKGNNDRPPEVALYVKDDRERDLILRPGDTFLVGNQTWRLERVDEAGVDKLGAVFARIE
ncbi:DUF6406 domain-containing protein [Actinomadura mexicana]|uniref:Uncharacterized protein n=1 Tax=Actinomadura mexicana TaxID=134959 RepID=A0A238X123_9ACTN|nr:DUF6406 domain-containing protein [Actinomadura mexicana]SNR52432.1 hypothetical protein SAMN06265355_103553 [Actinomadura mexicana]